MHMGLELAPRRDVMIWTCHHVAVDAIQDDPTADRLRKAVRAFRRSKAALERDRLVLREAIVDASARGKGTTEIAKLIDREYTEAHVSRMIHGKA